jgi:hypothetical protein
MFYLDPNILQLVGPDGVVPAEKLAEVNGCLQAAEELAKRMLGCTLIIRDEKFILSNLELYYGGAGDMAHDWHRTTFHPKQGLSKKQTAAQLNSGLCLYLKQNGKGGQNRMDLVVGNEGVAISLLVRNVHRPDGSMVGKSIDGNPALILREAAMAIEDRDHGQVFDAYDEISFEDSHSQYCGETPKLIINKRCIGGKYCGFEGGPYGQHRWNYRLEL